VSDNLCPFCLLRVVPDPPNVIGRYHAPCYFMAKAEREAPKWGRLVGGEWMPGRTAP